MNEKNFETVFIALVAAVALLIVFNQYQIFNITGVTGASVFPVTGSATLTGKSGNDLSKVDVSEIKSTAQGITLLFPIDKIKTTEDAISIMIPTGTPEYGQEMGVSFDDPISSMTKMARAYPALKKQAQENPEVWQRYLNLAAAPRGISCEFCCGVGPQGIDAKGNLRCGCEHAPALQTVALWLMLNTDYSDAEVLKEVYRWKSLYFPKNMVTLASQIAGGDTSVLKDLPGMVGGC